MMLKVSSNRITEGMILGRTLFNAQHRFLLTAGQTLTARYVRRIRELQIPFIYIDEQLGIEESAPLLNHTTYKMTVDSLKNCYEQYSQTMKLDIHQLQSQVGNIIDDLVNNNYLMIGMAELKNYDDYTYQHSVNVCALSIVLGISQGYSRLQLQNLGIGALLHDIGKIKIPLQIINKPDSLTFEEYIVVKKHPWEGFMMVNSQVNLPPSSINGILQHHERLDGRGYPRGLAGNKIHEYGLIIAVADVFDSLISDRPYRQGYSNEEAMAIIEREKGHKLSATLIDALFAHVDIYPPGSLVHLSSGDLAVVISKNPRDARRPRLKLLFDANKQVYRKEQVLDLSLPGYDNVAIIKALNNSEAEEVMLNYLSSHKVN